MPCEDYPCCGHRDADGSSWCPDEEGRFDCAECGLKMKAGARSAICERCRLAIVNEPEDGDYGDEPEDGDLHRHFGVSPHDFI